MTVWALLLLTACPAPAPPQEEPSEPINDTAAPADEVTLWVTLDGEPAAGVTVAQGGVATRWVTGSDGSVVVQPDHGVEGGEVQLIASHPEARTGHVQVGRGKSARIALVRFDPSDNPDYVLRDPGQPDDPGTTDQCSHCHLTTVGQWYESPHRTSASNPAVQDLYAGVASTLSEAGCAEAGGRWWTGLTPGTRAPAPRCYVGDGALPALNPCGVDAPCDGVATAYGGCADCHAPGIDGALGGRDLLDATGHAYTSGVHCEVCHHVAEVRLNEPPGVGGRLHVVRPSEPATGGIDKDWATLLFGPFDDVATKIMGAVPRAHFEDSTLCAGCHELEQPPMIGAADRGRWPSGALPIQSTYAEWLAGPMNPAAPCQSCHMPPDPDVGNAADLDVYVFLPPGLVPGWRRPPGAVREHAWYGPRQRESRMLELAASLRVDVAQDGGALTVDVTVQNTGPGHALPTGEPLRSMVLLVEASCDGVGLAVTGGDAVPDFGGALAVRGAGEDWSRWPGARPGQVIRVVRRPGGHRDYAGFGPFGDGTFDAAAKGMPIEEVVGSAQILAVDGDVIELDQPLPPGDLAILGEGGPVWDGAPMTARAGAPGFAFARVLVGADGRRMVPHFLAVDVASDNRLLPQQAFTTRHTFASACEAPTVHAVLVHRAWPAALAAERGWEATESVMAEVWR